jgi:hypothetical protein
MVILLGFIPVISIIGILANSAFLYVLYRVQDIRTTTNFYLANLAVADGMLLIIRSIRYIGTYLYSPIDFNNLTPFTSRVSCGIPLMLIKLFSLASVFFISLVALERYLSICRPLIHRRTNSRRRTLKLTLISWIVSFAIIAGHSGSFSIHNKCLVFPAATNQTNLPTRFRTCSYSYWANLSISIIFPCQFLFACFGNCTMYFAIVRRLTQRKRKTKKGERYHVAKMLSINACVFFICLTPMQVLYAFQIFGVLTPTPLSVTHILFWIAILVVSVNSAVNPLIYNGTNPDYRKAFRIAFTCTKRRSSNSLKPVIRRSSTLPQ